MHITNLEIRKLHGHKNYNLKIKDNILILVGENGAGKTTVLRFLYYVISGQFNLLSRYQFDHITITIDEVKYTITSSMVERDYKLLEKNFLRRMPKHFRDRFIHRLEHSDDVISDPEIRHLCDRYDIPLKYILRDMDQIDLFSGQGKKQLNDLRKALTEVKNNFKSQILYLPTYRRIEQELNLILEGVDFDESDRNRRRHYNESQAQSYTELIEFGMNDVTHAVKTTLFNLKEFARENLEKLTLGYLGDVVEKHYLEVDVTKIKAASDETIKNILGRIDKTILTKNSKEHLWEIIQEVKQEKNKELNEHEKVICHYLIKLLKFQQELEEKESQIRSFCSICNNYMTEKRFTYNSSSFSFNIWEDLPDGREREIELPHLSSGEKQIVSLFSHLYLSGNVNYFVLIDEPELSLSVPWQRRFLEDIKSGQFCSGLIAVTHSPFIYDNSLKKYAHGLGEFMQ